MLEHWGNAETMSPGGKYVAPLRRARGPLAQVSGFDGARVNLTEKVRAQFQQENNTPDLPGAYGTGGWTADDKSVPSTTIRHWEVKPTAAVRAADGRRGRKQEITFRYRSLDRRNSSSRRTSRLLLSAVTTARVRGFYRVASLAATAAPDKVVMLDKAFGAPAKAKNADTVVFTLSRFEEFPDLWVSDTSFKDMKKVSSANPIAAEYLTGRSEIIEYVNADGKKLRALLTKPENFDPNKKYPLMVYIY